MIFYLRVLAMAVWFLIVAVAFVPVCIVRFGNPNLFKEFLDCFAPLARRIFGITVEAGGYPVEEANRLHPCVFVCNHQSGLDVITFCKFDVKRVVGIGKVEILWIPFFGLIFWASGHVLINRSKSASARDKIMVAAKEMKERDISLAFMPEGTRNRSLRGLLPFKKGAFYVAVEAQVPIVPMVSSSLLNVMDSKTRHIFGGRVKLRMLPPVFTKGMTSSDVDSLTEKVRSEMLKAYDELSV